MAKILMVDDDGEFLNAGKTVLESRGFTVITASNAVDAEAAIKSKKPDLIILDIMMEEPDDGIRLAHKLKKQGLKIPVVMLSGVSAVTGLDYGKCDEVMPCEDFLEKPVRPEMLIKKVQDILGKKEKR